MVRNRAKTCPAAKKARVAARMAKVKKAKKAEKPKTCKLVKKNAANPDLITFFIQSASWYSLPTGF